MKLMRIFAAAVLGVGVGLARADFKAADEAYRAKNYALWVQACQEDAGRGEKRCQRVLGTAYKYGMGVEKNFETSIDWLKKAAAQGEMYAEEILGDCYKNGIGVKRDYQEALRWFKLSASRGNPWAFNNMANIYRYGLGVSRDPVEALTLYRIAAEKGNAAAQNNLADMYRIGDGVERNPGQAFQWALKSSSQNYSWGWNQLGLLYRDGIGVDADSAKAIDAFKRATQLRDPPWAFARVAFANLARTYHYGIGTPIDVAEALKWAEEGAQLNEPSAMVVVADILANRQGDDIPGDRQRAFDLANRAAQLSNVVGKVTLGRFYLDGIGTAADPEYGFKLLLQGRDAGNFDALVYIGHCYRDGKGVTKDPEQARQYYLMARAQQHRLSHGARTFVSTYFADPAPPRQPMADGANRTSGVSPVAAASELDKPQRELLDRLERMQRQLEALQATSSTGASPPETADFKVLAPRFALVVGNDKYEHVSALQNAREDARAIGQRLQTLGFTVSLQLDVNEKRFKQVLREFKSRLAGGEEVIIFFAGHGVQIGAANYLLPVDVKGDSEEQVKDDSIELQRILDDLKDKRTKFALAIIDACRDNPFNSAGRNVGGRGLAPTTAATGQMIMFSAGTGQRALDNLGKNDPDKNGLFTRVLLKEMLKPKVPVDRVLRNVRNEVVRLSKSVGQEQTPALYDQAVGDFYFKF